MKNKINIVFLGLFILLIFPFKIYARSYDAWGSTCPSSELPTFGRMDGATYPGAQSFCKYDTNAGSSDTGMNECAAIELSDKNINGGYKTEFIDNGRKRMYFYDSGRIDAWVGKDGIWEDNPGGLGIQVCPLMELSYNVTDPLPIELHDKYNVELISVSVLDFNDIKYNALNDNTIAFWNKWKVEYKYKDEVNYKVTKIGLDKANNEFSYNVYVKRLTAKGDTIPGLGWNGISGGGEGVSRVYHYWVPFVAIFEYDDPNPCTNDSYGQKYAYEHPNECCYEYPETCCGSDGSNGAATIDEIWNTDAWDMQALCCNPNPEIDYNIYVNEKKLPPVKTFVSYLDNSFIREQYNQKCSRYEFACKWNVDRSNQLHCCNDPEYKNNEDEEEYDKNCCLWNVDRDDPNHCCNTETYEDTARCRNNTIERNNCDNPDYFSTHKKGCCESADEETFEKNALVCCPRTTQQTNSNWNKVCNSSDDDVKKYDDERNRTCKNQPWVSSYESNSSIATLNEKLTIDSQSYPNNNPFPTIDAGQGFEYQLKIIDNITIEGSIPQGGYNVFCRTLRNRISNYNTSMRNQYTIINNNKYKTNFLNQNITFITFKNGINNNEEDNEKVYKYSIDENVLSNYSLPELSYESETLNCYEYNPEGDRIPSSVYLPIAQPFNTTLTYTVNLPEYYINQVGGEDFYGGGAPASENLNAYLNGGNKIYTSVNDQSGYYDMEIRIKKGGMSGRINSESNDNDPYTCSYIVANCIKDGTCIDDNNPPDDEYPPIKVNNTPYYFRPISLTNPFPNNRDLGPNWFGQALNSRNTKVEEYITGTSTNIKGDTVYSDPIYSIELTPDLISKIQDYNTEQDSNKGYLDWDTLSTEYNSVERTSNFLTCLLNGTNCNSNAESANLGQIDNIELPSDNDRKKKIGDFSEDGD